MAEPLARLRRRLARLGVAAATLLLAAWLIGRLASDRTLATQWLFWLPTPLVIAILLLGAAVLLPLRRTATATLLLLALLPAASLTLVEHRWWPTDPPPAESPADLVVAHWNASGVPYDQQPDAADDILATNPDLVLITDPGPFNRVPAVQTWLGDGDDLWIPPFTVLARHGLIEARRIVDRADINATLVRARDRRGRPVTLLAVDLPSDPARSRMEVVTELRRYLRPADLPRLDLVVGDFNLTRAGAALRHAFPDHRHLYDAAGRGWGATFPRRLPLWHIDHILYHPDRVRPGNYRLLPGDHGRHHIQLGAVHLRESPPEE